MTTITTTTTTQPYELWTVESMQKYCETGQVDYPQLYEHVSYLLFEFDKYRGNFGSFPSTSYTNLLYYLARKAPKFDNLLFLIANQLCWKGVWKVIYWKTSKRDKKKLCHHCAIKQPNSEDLIKIEQYKKFKQRIEFVKCLYNSLCSNCKLRCVMRRRLAVCLAKKYKVS